MLKGFKSQRPSKRRLRILVYLFLVLLVGVPIFFPSYTRPPRHYLDLQERCDSGILSCANPSGENVFITVSLYDRVGKFASGLWGEAVLQLIDLIGPNNVFLSIYEIIVES